jgi:DNA transformation protein and related proteins
MARQSEFVEYVLELLAPLGGVRARAMFGGFGIYRGDVMFAIIEKDRMFFKVNDVTRQSFVAKGLLPFTYVTQGKTQTLQYYEAPPEVFEEPEAMQLWARQAVDVALKAKRVNK